MLNELFEPDGKRLTSMLIGSPGTGKSFWTKHQLLAFSKRWKDEKLKLSSILENQQKFEKVRHVNQKKVFPFLNSFLAEENRKR